MVEVVLRINGAEKVQANLSHLARQIGDTKTANRAVAIQFYGWTQRNYNSDGSLVGGWKALAPSTVKRKAKLRKEQMLVISGHLRASIVHEGKEQAPTFGHSDGHFYTGEIAGIGTEVDYGKHHQEGTVRIPQRRFLPNEQEALEMGTRVYEFYVKKAVENANR